MPKGYAGKILMVDLTSGTMKDEVPAEDLYRDFIGGTGLGGEDSLRAAEAEGRSAGTGECPGLCYRPAHGNHRARQRKVYGRNQISRDRRLGRLELRRFLGADAKVGRLRCRLLHGHFKAAGLSRPVRGEGRAERTLPISGAKTPMRRKRCFSRSWASLKHGSPVSVPPGNPVPSWRASSMKEEGSPPEPVSERSWAPNA